MDWKKRRYQGHGDNQTISMIVQVRKGNPERGNESGVRLRIDIVQE